MLKIVNNVNKKCNLYAKVWSYAVNVHLWLFDAYEIKSFFKKNSNNDVIVFEISKSSLHTQLHLLFFSTETERRQTKCLFDHQNKQKK